MLYTSKVEDKAGTEYSLMLSSHKVLSKPNASPLESHVIEWINGYVVEWEYENPKELVEALLAQGGCVSGMVSHLIYHTETYQFYIDYRFEIEDLISELFEDGVPPRLLEDGFQIFYDRLAWIAFEETARNLILE